MPTKSRKKLKIKFCTKKGAFLLLHRAANRDMFYSTYFGGFTIEGLTHQRQSDLDIFSDIFSVFPHETILKIY